MIADPWAVLGLDSSATDSAIRARYRELVMAHPPEREPERFAAIAESYRLLCDPRARARMRIQGPPPLLDLAELAELLREWPRSPVEPEAWLGVIGE